MIEAMAGLEVDTPFGRVTWRGIDHQATMGAYVGRIAVEGGRGTMIHWRYIDGKDVMPSDEEIQALRPAS
jgi:branched-chain amino acid transport system substrate-binding protein